MIFSEKSFIVLKVNLFAYFKADYFQQFLIKIMQIFKQFNNMKDNEK